LAQVDLDGLRPEHWPRWTSTDYGFAAPWCTLWFARDPEGNRPVYVYRERYAVEVRDEEQAEIISSASEGERILANVLDPSMFNARTEQNKPSIAQVYASGGISNIVQGFNNRRTGWSIIRRALAIPDSGTSEPGAGLPRLRIFADACPNLERTLPAMVRDPLDPEDVADKLHGKKTEDHAPDALRYGMAIEAGPSADETVGSVSWG